jgi:hypothetical protein
MSRHLKHGVLRVAVTLAACCVVPGLAAGSPPIASASGATLTAGFSPNRLGAAAAMELGFQLHRSTAGKTPILTDVEFHLPIGVSLTTSELGLASCDSSTLRSSGVGGCQSDAVMGYGSALILAPDGAEALREPARVTVLMGSPTNRHTTLLFYASGDSPVIAQLLFSAQMVEGLGVFGADLDAAIPLTAGLPGEPDTTVLEMNATLGSSSVSYYESVHGRLVAYKPKGVAVPSHCPAGGFPFGAKFTFADGSTESASITTPCPARGAHAPRRRGGSR